MTRSNRREFLKTTGLAGVGFWVGSSVAAQEKSANGKISFAGVGVGGKGHSDIVQAAKLGPVVALCDIDENSLNRTAAELEKAGHKPKKFFDFRKMLEECKAIDAVTVSTPDHTHAPASIMAMKLGKHVYCQKPLTHSVHEARMMKDVAREKKVATQMGNQGTAENGLRRAVEIVRAGVLGQIKEIHTWTNRPVWDQAPTVMARPNERPEVPKHVHWDLFLGPAPDRPYSPKYHPFAWRGWWDFGTGALGDMACHTANMAFMACKLTSPTTIEAEARDVNPETCPTWAKVRYQFPARDGMAPLTFFWYEGREGGRHNKTGKKILPPEELLAKVLGKDEKLADSGSMLVGEKGILFSPNDYGAAYRLIGDGLEEAARKVTATLPRNGKGDDGMKVEWVEAMRMGNPAHALSNFEYAGALTEAILLGNVAIRAGKKIEWDAYNLKCTNCPEANAFVKREYRKGWTL